MTANTQDFLSQLFNVLAIYTSGTLLVATIVALVAENRKAN